FWEEQMIRTTGIALALALGAASMATAQTREAYELPDAITFPEGVALDAAGGLIYTAGAADGRLVAIDARTGESRLLGALPAPPEGVFPAALGMSLDGHGRLWVSGGRTGRMFVVDTRSGQLLKQFQIP